MKYNYDKESLKGLSVKPFLNLVKDRQAKFEQAPAEEPVAELSPNKLAKELHPAVQYGRIAEVTDCGTGKIFKVVPDKEKGTEKMAFFRAGQYVTVTLDIGGEHVRRPYTICSDPADALKDDSSYTLMIEEVKKGFVSRWIMENWKKGTEVTLSGPLGNFGYQPLRDAKHVIALAGGSGITPFVSLASAIVGGNEDFTMTILYGCRTKEKIFLKKELDELAGKSGGRVKVVYVLSDEEAPGYEHGFLTSELVKKYAPEGDWSVFLCGPKAMYRYEEKELAPLNLPRRRLRAELSGEYGDPFQSDEYPAEREEKEFRLTVVMRGKEKTIPCKNNQTLLEAMERAGIHAPSHCRSGVCGWCHSLVVEGRVFTPSSHDHRRLADEKFHWIHPCVTYPLTDIKLDVPVTDD